MILSSYAPYTPTESNWYKSLPYGFDFGSGGIRTRIYLPISPSNLSINMSMATNIITTLYGVVEEHSPIRYFDISIQGNTGIGPQYIGDEDIIGSSPMPTSGWPLEGRSSFSAGTLSGLSEMLGGQAAAITGRIQAVADLARGLGGGNGNPTGLPDGRTGYLAFHLLQLAFIQYKQEMVEKNSLKSLFSSGKKSMQFFNYKDNQRFDCIPVSFSMTRSADNPLLYNYSIRLRAFNLRALNNDDIYVVDNIAEILGLGESSGDMVRKIQQKISSVSTLISGAL